MEKAIAKRTLRNSYYTEGRVKDESKEVKRRKSTVSNTKTLKDKVLLRLYIKTIIALSILSLIFAINILNLEKIKSLSFSNMIKKEFKQNFTKEEIITKSKKITRSAYNGIKGFIPKGVKDIFNVLLIKTKEKLNIKDVVIYNEGKNSLGTSVENVSFAVSENIATVQDEEIFYIKENNISFVKPTVGTISSKYGQREVIFKDIDSFHYGLDIANKLGTKVVSSIDGTVTYVGNNKYNGNYVKITKGEVVTKYCHLKEYVVKKGEVVSKGKLIGYMGSTGYSTGPHLHFEIEIFGKRIDPQKIVEI